MNISSQVKKVCGHTEADSIHFKTAREREEEKRISSRMVCLECSRKMQGWLNEPGVEEMDFSLEPLTGTVKQVPWATDLRNKQKQQLGRSLMTAMDAAAQGDLAALGLYRALLVFFGITDSGFWIANSKSPLGFWHFKSDAERLLREDHDFESYRKRSAGNSSGETAYATLKRLDPSLLARIRQAVPSTPTTSNANSQ
ncbi:hypothetical protein RBE51_18035 [Pseudomonas taiwanensis]|uniref:hypothetical protein n=1 Tax=Pseudomonas taiwanensis TaxID=470150 RepID=UPI0028DD5A72|nr:hypothetical protein [Pseudomonas taiwanensis]MDT8924712.1 hypothetical protein [Pseudomonas taiwanensis]